MTDDNEDFGQTRQDIEDRLRRDMTPEELEALAEVIIESDSHP